MKNKVIRAAVLAGALGISSVLGCIVAAEEWNEPVGESVSEEWNAGMESYAPIEETPGYIEAPQTEGISQQPVPGAMYHEEVPPMMEESMNWQEDTPYTEERETPSGTWETEEIPVSIRRSERKKQVEDFEIPGIEEAEAAFGITADMEISPYIYLNVPELLQNPELPTGCESVALTMALQYEGFHLAKTTIAREFLIYNREDDNMALGYVGDPFSEDGAGCFAPALAATAMDFFEDQGYDYTAYEITGTPLSDLLKYVSEGTPVVLWTTMYMAEPEVSRDVEVCTYGDNTYEWYTSEHCVVLSGYDTEAQTLQINDPLEGIVTRDMAEFERIFNRTGQIAMVVRSCSTALNYDPETEEGITLASSQTEKITLDAGVQ
ncbi:MAG: C39 family peptidase [Eubacteriales bacterium]|nr:C39 family peptidase [Eubacteriales bacterium]